MKELSQKLFEMLEIIRAYSKLSGKSVDMTEPFTLPVGSTVMELAIQIHLQLAEKLKTVKVRGTGVYDGQNVQRNRVLNDKDIIELHIS